MVMAATILDNRRKKSRKHRNEAKYLRSTARLGMPAPVEFGKGKQEQ